MDTAGVLRTEINLCTRMIIMARCCIVCPYSTSIYGSAVCVYNVSSIDAVFRGPFKSQVDAKSAWTRVSNNHVVDCRASSSAPTSHPGHWVTGSPTSHHGNILIQEYHFMCVKYLQ